VKKRKAINITCRAFNASQCSSSSYDKRRRHSNEFNVTQRLEKRIQ